MSAGKEQFAQLMRGPHEQLDLGLAALLIAQEEYPDLDLDGYLRQLDDLGQQARDRLTPDAPPDAAVEALSRLLSEEHGFRGNQDDYYDPRNSFLNDVLDRRAGIPISLAAVYVEVGRRAGLNVRGVGFPAHFLAEHRGVIFDPFNGGHILSEGDCRALLLQMTGGSMDFQPRFLEPTPTKHILARMLNNLKQIYLKARYYRKAVGIMDRLLLVNPISYGELRDRGAVHAELKQYAQAKADFEAYLKQPHQPEDASAVRRALRNIDNVMTLMDD
ncbi:MAG TPA: tetratricopeptide repeat protein [Chloroflexota bacterium]|nr:tetratricopeptide repeat protein [Chloroflexota bacterium]